MGQTQASAVGDEASFINLVCTAKGASAQPLETRTVSVLEPEGATVTVTDGAGREYVRTGARPRVSFTVAGALGTHTLKLLDAHDAIRATQTFTVATHTQIRDVGGQFEDLLAILNKTMRCYGPEGTSAITWHDHTYRYFVHWILDHTHTAKGFQYFSDAAAGLVDLLSQVQREDGMIWSFATKDEGPSYFDSRDGGAGYTRRGDGLLLVRQPAENHCEYNFVDCMYVAWKGSGDDPWMKDHLPSAMRALDYAVNDKSRWSAKFQLLKRGYTIDSWDFQIQDEYAVFVPPLGGDMLIDPDRTKFGVFFGDNHGYAEACVELAEMLDHAGQKQDAEKYCTRGQEIHDRLNQLAFNGRFYTHRVEEDPNVKRNVGVDENSQIAMSNAYALNRGISHQQAVAVINTYLHLRDHLPAGAPGEFYAIYPPFGRGFGDHNGKWQYMNGGVHGHAAGELSRGAFKHGFERYGVDILRRIHALAKSTNGVVSFAYTGAYEPPPPAPTFTPINLSKHANMDTQDTGSQNIPGWMAGEAGNDMRNLPTGKQIFAGVPYIIADPEANRRAVAVTVAADGKRFPAHAEIPVGALAATLYLLHAAANVGPSGNGAALLLNYDDGARETLYLQAGKHFGSWWFPVLSSPDAGVAWQGSNLKSTSVGVFWAAVTNPQADKMIKSIALVPALDGATYALLGLTLADRLPYHKPGLVSFGGPDNWAGGLCTAALVEGLAGIANATDTTGFQYPVISPRWTAAEISAAQVTIHYPASNGYVAYAFGHDQDAKTLELTVTGNGTAALVRLLLPPGGNAAAATVNGKAAPLILERIETSIYATLTLKLLESQTLRIQYSA